MSWKRGSLSLEASLSLAVLLLLCGLFFSLIYGPLLQRRLYDQSARFILGHNAEKLGEADLQKALGDQGFRIREGKIEGLLKGFEYPLYQSKAAWDEPVDAITFITDTGSKRHRPG